MTDTSITFIGDHGDDHDTVERARTQLQEMLDEIAAGLPAAIFSGHESLTAAGYAWHPADPDMQVLYTLRYAMAELTDEIDATLEVSRNDIQPAWVARELIRRAAGKAVRAADEAAPTGFAGYREIHLAQATATAEKAYDLLDALSRASLRAVAEIEEASHG